MVGVGFTVIVNVSGGPVHETEPLEKVGVTVMVAVIGSFVRLFAVKLGIPVGFPVLEEGRPIDGLLLVQV
jgi:hypothetical protein